PVQSVIMRQQQQQSTHASRFTAWPEYMTVMNAINDALRPLGGQVTEMPFTPERILRALGTIED
ncbi:hypothetical protein, partial [Yoonia sp.]|uniref:hypothetical protein n=1 Tax=Yoonia sp. TaxID=2212373 RepID=UPI002DFC0956|nr:hypothetical protein [Yoonia sp.]